MNKPRGEAVLAGVSTNLDLLRAIAVLCVLTSHVVGALRLRAWGSLGRFGVILFFVHTSLVLMASLERMSRSATGWRVAVGFWIRRGFRIYPLAMAYIVLIAVFRIPAGPGVAYQWIGWGGLAANLTLVQNLTYSPDILGTLWSLPLEVQMYGLLPFAYVFLGRARGRSLLLWALAVPLAMVQPHLSDRLGVLLYGPCFVAGIVAFDLVRDGRERRAPAWVWPLCLFAAVMIFGPFDNVSLGLKIYKAWVLALGLALAYANVREAAASRLQTAFHWIAEQSYGIYLSHLVLLWVAFDVLHLRWGAVPFLAVTLVLVPWLGYRYVEHPLTLVGSHVSRRLLHGGTRGR